VIALDTNVLVRLVLQDDEAQARVAERLVVRARREDTSLFIADVVLCELVWVLTRRTNISRAEIAAVLDQLLRTELLVFSSTAVVERAVSAYRDGRGDFADYLIREHARAADATDVVTFDRALKSEGGFRVL
jgi:predicted nucleic-acid-binding protein